MTFVLDGIQDAWRLLVEGDSTTLHAVCVSLSCSVTAVALAAIIAIPYGAWLGFYRRDSRVQIFCLRLGMSVPTVIIGLMVYLALSRQGLFGTFDLLYTKTAIVIGEFLLAVPLLGTLSHGVASSTDPIVLETSRTFGASRLRALLTALGERRTALVAAGLATFSRCLTELGIAVTVGGNVQERTRTLPGAIQMELSRGDFSRAIAAGLVLVSVAVVITMASHVATKEKRQ